jgi:uncharacterized protein YyaL (SSP411 family)
MMSVKKMRQEMQDVLENNILHLWQTKMVDRENGGFYGRIDGHNVLHPEAEKGAILNARILWSFSAAYRVMRKPEYLEMATRARDYFIEHFIDSEFGGVFGVSITRGIPSTPRSSSMPSALLSMDSQNMHGLLATGRLLTMRCNSMTALRSTHWIVSITVILKPVREIGGRLQTCASLNLTRTSLSRRTPICTS